MACSSSNVVLKLVKSNHRVGERNQFSGEGIQSYKHAHMESLPFPWDSSTSTIYGYIFATSIPCLSNRHAAAATGRITVANRSVPSCCDVSQCFAWDVDEASRRPHGSLCGGRPGGRGHLGRTPLTQRPMFPMFQV